MSSCNGHFRNSKTDPTSVAQETGKAGSADDGLSQETSGAHETKGTHTETQKVDSQMTSTQVYETDTI